MLKLLVVSVVWLFTFSTSYLVSYATTVVEESALQLETEIVRQRYCEGDAEVYGLDLELKLRFQNVGRLPLILYKGSENVYVIKVSSSLEDAADGKYEVNASLTWYSDGSAWKVSHSSIIRKFVILPPGETYEAKTHARVFVTRKNVHGRLEGSVGDGVHYLQVTISTWYGSQELAERLRSKWSRSGLLWTKAVTSSPMKFIVEPKRTVTNCK